MLTRDSLRWLVAPLALIVPLVSFGVAHADEAPAPSASASAAHEAAPAPAPAPAAAHDAPPAPAKGTLTGPDADEDTDIPEPVSRKGEVVEVGFEITGITKIDPVKQSFEVEGVVSFASKKAIPKCDKNKIGQLFNGEAKRADLVEEHKGPEGLARSCKVAVEIVGDINVKRYPFDSQSLEIDVFDANDAAEGVEYHAMKDISGVYENVRLPGWDVVSFSAETAKEKEEGTKIEVSKASFNLEVRRPLFASFIKGLLAVLFQVFVTGIALLLPVKSVTNRITMVTGALLAIAATHNTISSQLNVPYLTSADKFFLACYFSLLVNVLFSTFILRADNDKNEARATALYKRAFIVVPIVTVVAMVLALLPIG